MADKCGIHKQSNRIRREGQDRRQRNVHYLQADLINPKQETPNKNNIRFTTRIPKLRACLKNSCVPDSTEKPRQRNRFRGLRFGFKFGFFLGFRASLRGGRGRRREGRLKRVSGTDSVGVAAGSDSGCGCAGLNPIVEGMKEGAEIERSSRHGCDCAASEKIPSFLGDFLKQNSFFFFFLSWDFRAICFVIRLDAGIFFFFNFGSWPPTKLARPQRAQFCRLFAFGFESSLVMEPGPACSTLGTIRARLAQPFVSIVS